MRGEPVIKAVFFDVRALLYGPQGTELLAAVLQGEGFAASPEAVAEAMAGLPAELREARGRIRTEEQEGEYHRALLPALLRALGHPDPGGPVMSRLLEALREYPAWWSMYPETLPVLAQLERRGLALGVIANWEPSLRRFLAEFEIDRCFRVILSSMAARVAKPDPRLFALGLEAMGCAPGEALHCGPSLPEDVDGARAAGLVPVWVNRTGISTGHEVVTVNDLRGLLLLLGNGGE